MSRPILTEAARWWEDHGVVFTPGSAGEWDDDRVGEMSVLKEGPSSYKMWYGGSDGTNNRIGYATSSDGIHWSRSPCNPVLDLGPAGSFDDTHASELSVLKDGATYKMWYTGNDDGPIGYATSSDGCVWTKVLRTRCGSADR